MGDKSGTKNWVYYRVEEGTQEKDSWMNMPLTVHCAHPSQYNAIALMIEDRQYFYSSLRGIPDMLVRRCQIERFRRMTEYAESHGDMLFYTACRGQELLGYMILYFGSDDDITGTPHAFLIDLHGKDEDVVLALLEKAENSAREAAMHYLVTNVSRWDGSLRTILETSGFVEEYSLFIHSLEREFPLFEGEKLFLIRAADRLDAPVMSELGRESVKYLISPYRRSTMEDAYKNYDECYRHLLSWLDLTERFAAFIAYERTAMKPAGMILLHLQGELEGLDEPFFQCSTCDSTTGQRQVSLLFLSVCKRQRGKYLGQSLINHASRELSKRGFTAMAGEILTINRRALATLLRRFSGPLEVEKYQMVKYLPEFRGKL